MRATPQSASAAAWVCSWLPLVVSVSSSRPCAEMARQRLDQPHQVLAHERLAAGEPDFAHALGDEGGGQPVDLLERKQILPRQERHGLGHAIDAAEIAAVGDRDAQIGDAPAERVNHGLRRRRHHSSASSGGGLALRL